MNWSVSKKKVGQKKRVESGLRLKGYYLFLKDKLAPALASIITDVLEPRLDEDYKELFEKLGV